LIASVFCPAWDGAQIYAGAVGQVTGRSIQTKFSATVWHSGAAHKASGGELSKSADKYARLGSTEVV